MRVKGKVCVITGGASGIGKALAERFHEEGAKGVVVADMQADKLEQVAASVNGLAVVTDVSKEEDIKRLVKAAEDEYGHIDVFVSNAGIARMGGEESSDADWQQNWDIHVMAHVYAARAVAEKMAARGEGYLINTASAAGLLTHVNSATYSVTKHAAVSFAEWLSINYGDRGVHVSVLAPQAVRTAMTSGRNVSVASVDGMIEPEQLADCVIETMDKEEFLILPHEQVREYMKRKALDVDRWLSGMRRFKAKRPESG
ncbi:SDR family oxidoreductase [Minwuia thermotolerans]|jgi:NAD(P)-dependent dehydrogenase (short-subunit alcohol dehydrogenase family)|uniref:Short-chain dehydrogenase n=1 Tax=Minwuia thermotolerans TaxID=2056226 RepID=A0A2M9G5N4_9PROT|nr:SDR family oxidoreductase [Minwuia thermotolerans]ANK80330.1 MAG: short-chain dehydrogenase [Rhizobiales bacterium NRL2]PJK31029.1 short-chain dehydrogenase [Minwuia thermotolerans]